MTNRLFLLMFLLMAFLTVVLIPTDVANAEGKPPRFTHSPNIVAPGDLFTVSGTLFDAASTAVVVSVMDADGQRTTLGLAILSEGSFSKSFKIPENLIPGRYLVHVGDSSGMIAINLTGTLAVTPTDAPWFEFSPTTSFPGGTIDVSASGFDPTSQWAIAGLAGSNGMVRLLGFTMLTDGAFSKSLKTSADLPPNSSYHVFVIDSFRVFAQGVVGPLTLAFASVKPTITVGVYPVGVAVDSLSNRIFVSNTGDDTLAVIDGASNNVVATVPVGKEPCAVGTDSLSKLTYVANVNSNDVTVIDTNSNTVTATVPVGRFPCAVGVIGWSSRIYVGNYGGNSVSVVDGSTNTVIATIPLDGPPFGIGVNPKTNRIYAATGDVNVVTVIDGATNTIITTVPVGKGPDAVGVNPITNLIYIGNYFSDTVSVLDGTTNTVIATIPVGKEPGGVAANPTTNHIFIGNYASNTVSVLDGATNAIIATLAVGFTPDGIAVNFMTNRVYSANSNTNNVSVIQD